jgi:hypothetical protein
MQADFPDVEGCLAVSDRHWVWVGNGLLVKPGAICCEKIWYRLCVRALSRGRQRREGLGQARRILQTDPTLSAGLVIVCPNLPNTYSGHEMSYSTCGVITDVMCAKLFAQKHRVSLECPRKIVFEMMLIVARMEHV